MGLRHLPGAPAGAGWGKEGKRHGEADEERGRGRLEARQSEQAPLQMEKQLPDGKGTSPGLWLYSLPSERGPPTAPRTVLPSVLDLGLLPEQSGMRISTCEAKSSVSPTPSRHLVRPPDSLCPLAHLPESRWPRLAILAGCDINQKLRLFCNFWNGFESLLRSCFIFLIFFTCAEVGECSGQHAEAPVPSHLAQPSTHLSFVKLLVPLINDGLALGQCCVPNGILAHGRNLTSPGQDCRAGKSAAVGPKAEAPCSSSPPCATPTRPVPCLHWGGGSSGPGRAGGALPPSRG